jgi:hypothetical protein
MRHAVLPQLDHGGAPVGHGAQAIVGIGQLQARGQARNAVAACSTRRAGEACRGLSEKPAAEREIGALAHERIDEQGNIETRCWLSASNVTMQSAACVSA